MKEADYKRKLVAEVNALRGGYARRYEDRFAVGMLDLLIKLPDLPPVWAEAKLINGNVFCPSQRQFVEGNRMLAAGLNVILIGWKNNLLAISPWIAQADYRTCSTGVDQIAILKGYLNEPR